MPVDTVSKSNRLNSSDAHFYDAREDQADIPNDWVMVTPDPEFKDAAVEDGTKVEPEVTPEVEPEPKTSLDVPAKSILNRPRGSSYVVPSPPPSARAASFSTSPPPNAVSASRAAAVQSTPSPQIQSAPSTNTPPAVTLAPATAPVQPPPPTAQETQPEEQPGSSFLPPIPRTSNFGFGFGPRQAKPRFPIDDDDEAPNPVEQQKAPEHREAEIAAATRAIAGTAAIAHHEQKGEAQQSPPQPSVARESLPSQSPNTILDSVNQGAQHQDSSQRTQQAPVPDSSRRVPPIETNFQHQPLSSHPASTRPPLVQASSSEYSSQQGSTRPPLSQAGSSDYGQRTMTSDPKLQQQPPRFIPPRATDVAFKPQNFTESHVEWRPNRPKVAPAPTPASPSYWKEQDIPPPRSSLEQQSLQSRNSWEPQRGRGYSGSSQSYSQRADSYGEKGPWVGSPQQQKPFEQPPSAAQRYPDLFRPENPVPELPREGGDLPDHYYQGPIPRAAAFLPRQQTNEYQLPGVGPPTDEPRSAGSRRNSGFFKEIGGRLSRASSRERNNSISRDGALPSPTRPFEARGEYADSEAPSEGALEQKKRRSGFFGGMKRGSTSGLGPPVSQESVIAHHPGSHLGSRTDLLTTPQPSPPAHERKRSIFGLHSGESKTKPNKLTRASTGTSGALDDSGKKIRFSGFTGLLGKPGASAKESVQETRPQPTRELSYAERQPLESPGLSPGMTLRPPVQAQTPPQKTETPSQQRRVLSKLTSSPSQSPRQESKTRRPSASGILGGLMGRRSHQLERGGSDDSRSQGSQPQLTPQPLPAAQTYTDLQEQQAMGTPPPRGPPQQSREVPFQDQSIPPPDRGRRVDREPQYDSVPIPGGYTLVRGQGAIPVPTEYDPRGYNRQQVDSRYAQPRSQGFYQPNPSQGYQQTNGQQHQSAVGGRQAEPNLSAIETYDTYPSRNAPRRLSREDLLARSPPKSPEGQQRPYQLSLPDEDSDSERPAPIDKDLPVFPSPPSGHNQPIKHDAIQRLQQPTLRHPESPAGYPLPDDTVFSPINPAAQHIPAPPAPRWPGPQHQHQPQHASQERHQHSNSLTHSLSTMDIDLDRSNTRRTAVSAVSGISDPHNPIQSVRGSLNVPGKNGSWHDESVQNVSVMRSSPTPPSPMGGTPEREVSPEPIPRRDQIKTTELHIRPPSGSGEDLYNASPRIPKTVQFPSSSRAGQGYENSNLGNNGNGQVKRVVSESASGRAGGKENEGLLDRRGGSERGRRLRSAQEEKILIGDNGEEIEVEIDENEPPSMSATSYPGQEW